MKLVYGAVLCEGVATLPPAKISVSSLDNGTMVVSWVANSLNADTVKTTIKE